MDRRHGDLIIRLAGGISHRRMYFDSHPRVLATARETAAELSALLRDDGATSFSFGVCGGKFVRDGRYLVGPSIAGRALIDFAERLGCGGFEIDGAATAADLVAFFRLAAGRLEPCGSLAEARALFAASGLGRIALAEPLAEVPDASSETADGDHDGPGRDFAFLVDTYQAMYEAVSANALAVGSNGSVDRHRALEAGAALVGLGSAGALDVMQFLRYPDYDSYTIGHSVRVAALCALLGRQLGWPEPLLAELAAAGLLHDLGKGRIPPEILFKPGRLDDDERRVVEEHPELGARVLLDNGEESPVIIAATWGHHLRHAGGGYPRLPQRHEPGIVAELVHVCDVFEALTAQRPYKRPLSPRFAYELMLGDEASFHPRLLAALVQTLGLYPPGSEVRLGDSRRAVVVARGPGLDRPEVRLTHGPRGEPLAPADRRTLALAAEPGLEVAEIITVGIGGGPGAA